jgi:hypothetical protein
MVCPVPGNLQSYTMSTRYNDMCSSHTYIVIAHWSPRFDHLTGPTPLTNTTLCLENTDIAMHL